MRAGRRIRIQQIGTPPPINIRTVDVASDLRAGDPYAGLPLQADGPSSGITWAVTAGELPPGWLLSSEGVVPPGVFAADAQGSYAATVTASAAGFSSDSVLISVDVGYPRIRIVVGAAPSIVPDGVTAYSIPGGIRVEGGSGSFGSMTKSAGNIAPGLSLTGSGVLWNLTGAGTAAGAGQNFLPTFSITDTITSEVATVDIPLSVQPLAAANPLGLTYPVPSPATEGAAFTPLDPVVANAIGTLSYTMAGIMGDVAINPTTGRIYVPDGTLTGATPGASYPLDVVVSDAGTTPARTASYRVNYTVAPLAPPTISVTFSPNPLPTGTPGSAYSATATASGFTGNAVWEVPGVMPAGVTTAVSGANNSVLTWTATSIGAAAANQGFGDILAVSSSLVPSNRTTKAWSIPVGPLPSAFEAPSLITSPAMIEFDADQDGSATVTAATYIDFGTPAPADVTVSLEPEATLQPGVSLGTPSTGAGSVPVDYDRDGGVNVQADALVGLWVEYEDPTAGGGGPPLQNTLAERLAWWNALKAQAGTKTYEDYSGFTTSAEMRAASVPFGRDSSGTSGGDLETPGETRIILNGSDGILGGNCLEVVVMAAAGRGNAGWKKEYGFSPYDYRPFYVLTLNKLNKAALGWISHTSGASSPQSGNKFLYLSKNKQGQVFHSAGEGGAAWLQTNKHVTSQLMASRTIGGTLRYFTHGAIDNGTPTETDLQSIMLRYGIENRNKFYGVAEDNEYSDVAAVPYLTDRPGWPYAPAVAGGSLALVPDEWFITVDFIDPAPRDYFPLDGSGPSGRKPRVITWAAPFWSAPRLLCDTFCPDDNGGGYQSALHTQTNDRFTEFGLHHYYTDGGVGNNPTRPDMRYFNQVLWCGYTPPVWPGHPTATLTSPYGAIVHYSGWSP